MDVAAEVGLKQPERFYYGSHGQGVSPCYV